MFPRHAAPRAATAPPDGRRDDPAGTRCPSHFKQSEAGVLLPEVGPGEIDWPGQLAALRAIGYTGRRLFEIPPGAPIWARLERSRRYLESIS